MSNPISMSAPDITEKEVNEVNKVMQSTALSIGPRVDKFESEFAKYVGTRYASAVSSGTAGLHLCMILADVHQGDYVITTPLSFIASANCILYQRGIPIFVDIDPATGNMDPGRTAEAINMLSRRGRGQTSLLPPSLKTGPNRRASDIGSLKAVLAVHLFGQPCDLDPIQIEARRHKVKIIEDACEAIGSQYKGRQVGTQCDAAVFAFYPNKQMTTGEGGMIVYDSRDWDIQFRSLRNQGRDVFDAWLNHSRLGFNYRMDEMSAAFGLVQLRRIETLLTKRSRVARWYEERIAAIPGVKPITITPTTSRMSWFIYAVRLDKEYDRNKLMLRLENAGIPSRPYFTPIHLQPFYQKLYGYRIGDFPEAEAAGASLLALPFHGNMTRDQVDRVSAVLRIEMDKILIKKKHQVFTPKITPRQSLTRP